MQRLMRIEPAGRAGDYQTFAVRRRPDTTVAAACRDMGCLAWRHGWVTKVDETTDHGAAAALYIRRDSGRTFQEMRDGALTVFRFASGQRCFVDHRTIPETFIVRTGDWRVPFAQRRLIRHHVNGADWSEDMGEHLDRLAEQRQRG